MPADPDQRPVWVPHADAFVDSRGNFIVKVELAAMQKEHLELAIEGDRLLVSGRRLDVDRDDSDTRYFFNEIPTGQFAVTIDVPPGFDLQFAKAAYQNGMLRVDIPAKDSPSHGTSPRVHKL